MKDGKNEEFRLYMNSGEKEMEQLESDCKKISERINEKIRNSPDPRPLTNPVQVFVSSYTLGQETPHSHIFIAVNSSWTIAESARLQLESIGYKTGSII